ncbi:MAG: response regulator [Proteobacteria bacterium]|nr:response regulator [Pseudomonadota bacterium]
MRSLRLSLVILFVAVLLPILIFATVQALIATRQERETFESNTQGRVKQVIEELDRQLYGEIKVLQILSYSELLDTASLARFYEQTQRVVATEPNITHILLAEPGTGRQLFTTLRPFGTQLPNLIARDRLTEAVSTRRPVISGILAQGSVTRKPLVSVWVPVVRDDHSVPYGLAAVFDVNSLKRLLLADNIPNSWTGTLLDRAGLVIVSTRGPEELIGTAAPAGMREALASGQLEGIYSGALVDGVETITPYYTSRLSGWSVHYAVPRDEIEGPLLRSSLITFGTGGLSVLAALLLAGLVARDIAQRRRAEQTLEESQRLEIVGRMTGGMAHDFNNLLTVILGNLEIAAKRVKADARATQALQVALGAVERGSHLIQQLLAFARRQPLQPRAVAVNALVRKMMPLIKQAIGSQIEQTYRLEGSPDWCLVDPAQLESALLNLAINARDAMPNGGKLTVRTRSVEVDRAAPQIEIAVADTGVGMAPDVVDKAFQPFFTTKEIGKGTGLGLSQVYGFIQQSGGKVAIESKIGAGTTVILRLPAAAEAAVAETMAGITYAVAGATRVVLLVDDEADVRATIAATLREHDYEVLEAVDGSAAIDRLMSGGPIDLVICDVAMPGGVNGVEVAREARRLRPAVKVLLISGDPSAAVDSAAGAPEFPRLSKPFRQADLMRELGAMLAG